MLGSVRHSVRLPRPAAEVWELVGDPARLHEWFPGIDACTVEGTRRTITTSTGLAMPEEILVSDPLLRRFQYRLDVPIVAHHRGTIDVHDLGDDTCLVVYSTDADPRTMALTIGGATRGALEELARRFADPSEED
ncbi:MAG: SRPBCC family protein [Acidimicrobiales bacterium]|nr:SRPBCC family protein [Acidimicrobiales bacterium]